MKGWSLSAFCVLAHCCLRPEFITEIASVNTTR